MNLHEPQQFRITAQLLLSILGGELYASHDYSLWEIVRNAVCACMPNTKQWVAGAGDVEIFLQKHPFTDAVCLVILDHGRGFTTDGFERFFTLGASVEDLLLNPEGMHGGASQKRIGRFAALALNLRCFGIKTVHRALPSLPGVWYAATCASYR
jgi:HSP90 family molecular chaperone